MLQVYILPQVKIPNTALHFPRTHQKHFRLLMHCVELDLARQTPENPKGISFSNKNTKVLKAALATNLKNCHVGCISASKQFMALGTV